jgi:hypothetical protein
MAIDAAKTQILKICEKEVKTIGNYKRGKGKACITIPGLV